MIGLQLAEMIFSGKLYSVEKCVIKPEGNKIGDQSAKARKSVAFCLAMCAVLSVGFVFGLSQSSVVAEEAPQVPAEFPGRIEALDSYDVSNLIDGVVTKVHFKPGQTVEAGDILFSIDAGSYELSVKNQRLNALRAETMLVSARRDLERIKKLKDRGSATDVQLLKAEMALSLGDAMVQQAKAELTAAEDDLDSTTIVAEISGIISRSEVSPGAYVEAGGAPLARIVQMDPVRLSYAIPYIERIEQLGVDDLRSPRELLQRVTLKIKLSETWMYSETTTPDHVSASVDYASGTMTIWAELDNPRFQLRPGMRVRVLSIVEEQ